MIRDTFRDASMFYIEKKILLKISKFGKLWKTEERNTGTFQSLIGKIYLIY